MSRRHPIDDYFNDRLADYSSQAPMPVFDRINQKRNWKYKLKNQWRLHGKAIFIATLSVALLAAVLLWPINYSTTANLGAFPIPIEGHQAQLSAPADKNVIAEASTPTTPVKAERPTDQKHYDKKITPETKERVKAPPTITKQNTTSVQEKLVLKTVPEINTLSGIDLPAEIENPQGESDEMTAFTRPAFEELSALFRSKLEQDMTLLSSFAPDPKCASFGPGDWRLKVSLLAGLQSVDREITSRNSEFDSYAQSRKNSETPEYAMSTELRVSAVSGFGLAARTGLNYSQVNERFDYYDGYEEEVRIHYIYDSQGNVTGSDTTIIAGTREKVTHNRYQSLNIPLLLGYEVNLNKLTLAVSGGAFLNIYFRARGEFYSPDDLEPIRFTSDDPSAYPAYKDLLGLSWYGSLSVLYEIGPRLHVAVEPHVHYYPQSITRDYFKTSQSYFLTGLSVGLRKDL